MSSPSFRSSYSNANEWNSSSRILIKKYSSHIAAIFTQTNDNYEHRKMCVRWPWAEEEYTSTREKNLLPETKNKIRRSWPLRSEETKEKREKTAFPLKIEGEKTRSPIIIIPCLRSICHWKRSRRKVMSREYRERAWVLFFPAFIFYYYYYFRIDTNEY